MMRSAMCLLFVAACGGSGSHAPVANTTTMPAATTDAAVAVAADDCEAPTTSDQTTFGVHAIEVPGGTPHPFRWADANNRVLATPFLFDNGPDYWQEGFARIIDGAGKMGFIDEHGTIVVPPTYDWVYPFCHGIAKTARGGVGGYIDRTGAPTTGPTEDPRPLIPEKHVD